MKPFLHARSSAKKYGGEPSEYADIHNFLDSSKSLIADHRHRALLHNAWGCFIVEKVFGETRVNSAGKEYSTRDIAEGHILEDLGFIPSAEKYLQEMKMCDWMGGPVFKDRVIKIED